MLILPIKKKWFEMIRNGEKKEEYRELKQYYHKRLGKYFINDEIRMVGEELIRKKLYIPKPKEIVFRNGYSYNSPSVKCLCDLSVGSGKVEWGAEPNKEYYVLKILEILEVRDGNQ